MISASRRVTSIEVNGTFYGTFNPETFRKWFDETPLARSWERGEEPEQLPLLAPRTGSSTPRDVFVNFINGAKEHAPAAAEALNRRLSE